MLWSLLRDAGWDELSDLISPAFFEVLPATVLRRQTVTLARNLLDRRRFGPVWDDTRRWLGGCPVTLDRRLPALVDDGAEAEQLQGEAVLVLFFRQILERDTAVLDLRSSAFSTVDGRVAWAPTALWASWDPSFLVAIRDLYTGFYDDDEELFDRALIAMDLVPAREALRAHFGVGDQRSVVFDTTRFRETFHDVFVACRESGTSLHPDFVVLGLFLATLYEHLDGLGGAWDVRAAWQRARSTQTLRAAG